MSSSNFKKSGSGHFLVVAGEAEGRGVPEETLAGQDDPAKVRLPLSREAFDDLRFKQERERESPEERVARIEREAYEKGFEQGRKDGLALEVKQTEERTKQFDLLFRELSALKARLCSETEGQLLKLSTAIARKIIREEVRVQPQIIRNMIRAALEFLMDKSQIRILIHPEDMEEIRQMLPEIAALAKGGQFQVIEDHAVERGGCFLDTGFGSINATLEDQIGMIERVMEQSYKAYEGKPA